jgi:hypothetical protein
VNYVGNPGSTATNVTYDTRVNRSMPLLSDFIFSRVRIFSEKLVIEAPLGSAAAKILKG